MEQIRSREAIREEGETAAREGRALNACPYLPGTDSHEEWENGYHRVARTDALLAHNGQARDFTTGQGRQLAAMLEKAAA